MKKTDLFILLISSFLNFTNNARSEQELEKIYAKSTFTPTFTIAPAITNTPYVHATYTGSILFPQSEEKSAMIRIYHKGCAVDSSEGSYVINGNRNGSFFIAIGFLQRPENNTVACLKIATASDYTLYECIRSPETSSVDAAGITKKTYTWNIIELPKKTDCTLLDSTLIILVDPSLIEAIVSEEGDAGSSIIKLPTIKFKQNLTKDIWKNACTKSFLAAIDLDPFHKKQSYDNTVKISSRTRIGQVERNEHLS